MTFGEELKIFSEKHPYQEIEVNGAKVRYVLVGKRENPPIVFLNGLDMQEMWIKYVTELQSEYRALMFEYPLAWNTNQKMVEGLHALLSELNMSKPVIIGGSDGGVLAQLYSKVHPHNVSGMVLITTLTIESDYVRDIKKTAWVTPLLKLKLKISNWEKMKHKLIGIVTGYFRDESEEEKIYGKSFFEAIVANPKYKEKYIHAVELVGDLAKYEPIPQETFAFLSGKVLLMLPEQDIFTKEDQQRLVEVMTEPEVKNMAGGHITFVMKSEEYLEEIKNFLPGCFLNR